MAEIRNTGRISEEDQERLLHSDCRGRGLHITARLIKRMEGKFDVEFHDGQTIFRLFLPIANGTRNDEDARKAAGSDEPPGNGKEML
jgi:hypothetical protein